MSLPSSGEIVARASTPAGSSGVPPRESSPPQDSQRDAAATRSRGRLRYKNKMHPLRRLEKKISAREENGNRQPGKSEIHIPQITRMTTV
jgi:hypothetical protein